ncbi:MAG: hypothetical protein CL949_15295 [Erythrobacter sp.]|nr:hypothetical protein [Erythrobacter sp.]
MAIAGMGGAPVPDNQISHLHLGTHYPSSIKIWMMVRALAKIDSVRQPTVGLGINAEANDGVAVNFPVRCIDI